MDQLRWEFQAGDREGYLKFFEENLKFHSIIASASGNRLLAQVVIGLLERMHRLVILRLDLSSTLDELVGEHRRMLVALRQRDPVKAREHMQADISGTYQVALESLKKHIADWHL